MELIDYLKIIRKYFGAVVITVFATIVITAVGTTLMPKTYTATVIMQSNQNFNLPTFSSTSTSQLNASLNNIVGLANQSQFKQEIIGYLKKQNNGPVPNAGMFSISAELINQSNLIELKVNASRYPKLAKRVASIASSVLVDRTTNATRDKTDYLVGVVSKKIRTMDDRLAAIRKKVEAARDNPIEDAAKQRIKMAALADELKAATDSRKTYNDFIDRLILNNDLTKARLQLVYPAATPAVHSSPNMKNNLIISLTVGLMLGVALVSILGKENFNGFQLGKDKE